VRYLLLAFSVAILFTSAACHVHVAGTSPSAMQYPPPAAPTHPPLSEVAVIYVDQWGISEPQYRYLSHDLHLSDDDIGVVLFLADRSPWNWRRIAAQRRAGHDWNAITRMVGLTPVVYFVDIPRGAPLRDPYQGLYRQYWRFQGQPQRIHLGDTDCVAMARLHLVRERYDYDPVAYMGPGADRNHHVLLRELESQRRGGARPAAPPPRPLAHKANPGKDRRPGAVRVGHGPSAEPERASGDERAVRRGSVAHGSGPSPAAPGHAVTGSAAPPPGHGAAAARARMTPPGHSEKGRFVGHEKGGQKEPSRVVDDVTPPTNATTRARLTDPGPRRNRGAAGASNPAPDEESAPVARGDVRGTKTPNSATARDTGKSTARTSSPPSTAATAAAAPDRAADHPTHGTTAAASPQPNHGAARGRLARAPGTPHEAASNSAVATQNRDTGRTASQPHPPQSDEDVAQDDPGADTPVADADADDPEPVSHGGAARGTRSQGRP